MRGVTETGRDAGAAAVRELPRPDPHAHSYPRPQLRREGWVSLNGTWDFALDSEARWSRPDDVEWSSKIEVPFAPETPASGIDDRGFHEACWYRREFDAPPLAPGDRLHLHFGAVDHEATVIVNGIAVASHGGGYTPFTADVTDVLVPDGPQTLVVHARDDPHDLEKPRGKQDWLLQPHSIWYLRTTGIWRTVWLEVVPATRVEAIRWRSNLERWELELEATIVGADHVQCHLRTRLHAGDNLLVDDVYSVVAGAVHRRIALSDPGIDDYRNELLWSPESPTLIEAELELVDERGERLDRVESYTALREVAVQGDRFFLNHRPYQLRLVLNQGYWPETGPTAPSDDAFRLDIELIKAMGFNGVRMHEKIEDPRFFFWADRLGLVVWAEMPSAYRFTRRAIERTLREWGEVLDRDASHPSVITWVPFNESSGVPDLAITDAQRRYVEAVYELTHAIDPSRPVVGNDGWENIASDIVGVHDYEPVETLRHRYGTEELLPKVFERQRFGSRRLIVGDEEYAGQPIVLSEFGGLALNGAVGKRDEPWGYQRVTTPDELAEAYTALLEAVHSFGVFSGFCYTQFADTYQEVNGLVRADRTPKIPLDVVARATMPPPAP